MATVGVTIFHNPQCGTSRATLALIEAAGVKPTVVEYLQVGWTKDQLKGLLAQMGAKPRDILRSKEALAQELGLTVPEATSSTLLKAMVAYPNLVERPIVATPKGAVLCRPAERVLPLLER